MEVDLESDWSLLRQGRAQTSVRVHGEVAADDDAAAKAVASENPDHFTPVRPPRRVRVLTACWRDCCRNFWDGILYGVYKNGALMVCDPTGVERVLGFWSEEAPDLVENRYSV
jgi:hypothetical protein